MNKSDLCKLIIDRSSQLQHLRKQANNHQNYQQLFMAAIAYLIKDPNTQRQAYEEISELVVTANPSVAKSLAQEILIHIPKLHTKTALQQHVIFWTKAYDGTIEKKQYPNCKSLLKTVKIKERDRALTAQFKDYFQRFSNNYNELHDQRIEFFEDFDDEIVSESLDNDSKIYDIVYLNIMELKIVRNKFKQEKLSEQQMHEQLNKLRYFIKLKKPALLSEAERKQYEVELHWAQQFLLNQEEQIRKNQSISINQTFQLSLDEQNIQILDRKQFQQKRLLKNDNRNSNKVSKERQYFEDSLDLKSSGKPDLKLINPKDSKTSSSLLQSQPIGPVYRASNQKKKGIFSSYASPMKEIRENQSYLRMQEQQYKMNDLLIKKDNQSKKAPSVSINNQPGYNNQDDEELHNLVVHKYGGKNNKSGDLPQKPRDFSVTQNYFNKQMNNGHELASPTYKQAQNYGHAKSQTLKQWQRSEYMSPRNSRCKLSEFTSEKKQRKQLAPRNQLSFPEDYAINPYLVHFKQLSDLMHFRRNCFERTITLYSSSSLVIGCSITKEMNNQLKVQITYSNNEKAPLQLQSVYKIPLCYTIEKKSKISKRFTLHNTHSHIFTIGIQQFPLEACIINLKHPNQQPSKQPIHIPFPITIINFIDYLFSSEAEWTRQWEQLSNDSGKKNFWISRHIELDRQASGEELDWLLRDYFMRINAVEGYSIEDYGCCCFYSAMNNLQFLIRLSVRVNNIISLQMVSYRAIDQSEQDFMRYILNIWMFLLTKL